MKAVALFLAAIIVLARAQSCYDIIVAQGLTSLKNALTSAATTQLNMTGANMTVFAPKNEAVDSANIGKYTPAEQDAILLYHIGKGKYTNDDLKNSAMAVDTYLNSGNSVNLGSGASQVLLAVYATAQNQVGLNGYSFLTGTSYTATNGIVHVVSSVVFPPETTNLVLKSAGYDSNFKDRIGGNSVKTMGAMLDKNGLNDTINTAKTTLLVPIDSSFSFSASASDTLKILNFHIIPGNVLYMSRLQDSALTSYATSIDGGEKVTFRRDSTSLYVKGGGIEVKVKAEIQSRNGNILIIDNVLIPSNVAVTKSSAFSRSIGSTALAFFVVLSVLFLLS